MLSFLRSVVLPFILIYTVGSAFLACTDYNTLHVEPDQTETVFIGTGDRKFLALDAQTGTRKWEFSTSEVVTVTPTVHDGTVYVGSDHVFYALDAKTGTKKWEFATGPRPSSRYIPAVSNGTVYVFGDNRQILYALDARTGAKKWTATSKSFAANGGWYNTPLVADGLVYVGGTDTTLYALDALSGAKKWNFRAGSGFYTQPAIADGIVYAGSYDGKLYALDARTGTQKWAATVGGYVQSPKVNGESIYITNWSTVVAFNRATGTQTWRFTPVINGNYTGNTGLIAIDNETIYGGFVPLDWNDGFIYSIDAATGTQKRELWAWPGGLNNTTGRALLANGTLYIACGDHTFRAMDPETHAEKWTYKASDFIAYPLCILTKQGVVVNDF
ncbi:outer membrane protein assembly factor BamB family protein [Spirosoma koreense]